ncbi:MAG: hypothetical protein RBU37_19040 [Myxococcota bacterium]|nr:hypothetical protein [Myxococcota bacterium]
MDARQAKAFLERLCAQLAAQQRRVLPAVGLAVGLSACSVPQETKTPPPEPADQVSEELTGEAVSLYAAPTIDRLEPGPVPAYAAPSPELLPAPPIVESPPELALSAAPTPTLEYKGRRGVLYEAPTSELEDEPSRVALYEAPTSELSADQVELTVALYDAPSPTVSVLEPLDGNYVDAIGIELGSSRTGTLSPADGDKADWVYLRIPRPGRLLLSVRFENPEAEGVLIVRDAARQELSRLTQTGTQSSSLETMVDEGRVYLELTSSSGPTAYTFETKLEPLPK